MKREAGSSVELQPNVLPAGLLASFLQGGFHQVMDFQCNRVRITYIDLLVISQGCI